jgi:hypothetical protein
LLAWIEPTADGRFEAAIAPARTSPDTSPTFPTVRRFGAFDEAREWIEGNSVVLGQAIRWMSSP